VRVFTKMFIRHKSAHPKTGIVSPIYVVLKYFAIFSASYNALSGKYTTRLGAQFLASNTSFYLRTTKIFTKSRYSRNRQLYRTGVYLCL
jgi:hypothetical protein